MVLLKAAFRELSTGTKYHRGGREGKAGTLRIANLIHVVSTVGAFESVLKPPSLPQLIRVPSNLPAPVQ